MLPYCPLSPLSGGVRPPAQCPCTHVLLSCAPCYSCPATHLSAPKTPGESFDSPTESPLPTLPSSFLHVVFTLTSSFLWQIISADHDASASSHSSPCWYSIFCGWLLTSCGGLCPPAGPRLSTSPSARWCPPHRAAPLEPTLPQSPALWNSPAAVLVLRCSLPAPYSLLHQVFPFLWAPLGLCHKATLWR